MRAVRSSLTEAFGTGLGQELACHDCLRIAVGKLRVDHGDRGVYPCSVNQHQLTRAQMASFSSTVKSGRCGKPKGTV
jgi:hypothetical protein